MQEANECVHSAHNCTHTNIRSTNSILFACSFWAAMSAWFSLKASSALFLWPLQTVAIGCTLTLDIYTGKGIEMVYLLFCCSSANASRSACFSLVTVSNLSFSSLYTCKEGNKHSYTVEAVKYGHCNREPPL